MEQVEEANEKKGFFAWLSSVFHKKEDEEVEKEAPHYKRRLFDGRIEKYLDQNMNAYVSEYGIVTGLDLEVYEERYQTLTTRATAMKEYMSEADANVSKMERELVEVQAASKKKK